ncbi:hypothetical protein M885DRAFT_545091 [Pelagophyceae sp. CCMP2097]|nr:hypothetical protein M885DRAFT_545091 [Pelagophyceae sp. CCMP2097]
MSRDTEPPEDFSGAEEVRVLFAAATYGRADIVASAAKALATKRSVVIGGPVILADELGKARNEAGHALLEVACAHGKVDAVRALLRLGAFPLPRDDAEGEDGEEDVAGPAPWLDNAGACRAAAFAELMQQVAMGEVSRVTSLVALLGECRESDRASFGGDSPLHWAASFGQASAVDALLEAGADVDALNDDGATALHEAAKGGAQRADIITRLLVAGADSGKKITDGKDAGKTPLDVAVGPVIKALLASSAPETRDAPAAAEETNGHEATGSKEQAFPEKIPEISEKGAASDQGAAARCRAPLIWPPPRRCRLLRGADDFELGRSDELVVAVHCSVADIKHQTKAYTTTFAGAVRVLRVELGGRFDVVVCSSLDESEEAPHVRLCCCTRTTAGAESYRIVVSGELADVVAYDGAGLRHAASTLAQLLRFHATSTEDRWSLPALAIDDGPDAAVRGCVLDARSVAAPRAAQLFDDARRLASWRYNTFFVHIDLEGLTALEEEVASQDSLPWHSIDGGDGGIDDLDGDRPLEETLLGAFSLKCERRGARVVPTFDALGASLAGANGFEDIIRGFKASQVSIQNGENASVVAGLVRRIQAIKAGDGSQGVQAVWLWNCSDEATAAASKTLNGSFTLGSIIDGCDGDSTAAARLLRRKSTTGDALIVGGANASRCAALRQAPQLASLVIAARAARAERCGGVIVRSAPCGRAPSAAFPRPLSDATALLGAGLAWRADAGADSPAAGGGRALSQAELESVTAAQLWRLDPPRTRGDVELDDRARRAAAAAAAVVCGRRERKDASADGRGRSLLSECQRGEHWAALTAAGDDDVSAGPEIDYEEGLLWPPTGVYGGGNAMAVASDYVKRLVAAAKDVALDEAKSARLRAHHVRLADLLVCGGLAVRAADSPWKWSHDELGFFFDAEAVAAEAGRTAFERSLQSGALDDMRPDACFSLARRGAADDVATRLRHVSDELHIAVDLLRWMARLQQILVAKARAGGNDTGVLGAVASGTRSDVANRLLELLQRGAAVWARRHAAAKAPMAFAAAPLFLAELTFDLANFKPAEIERLMFAAVAR